MTIAILIGSLVLGSLVLGAVLPIDAPRRGTPPPRRYGRRDVYRR